MASPPPVAKFNALIAALAATHAQKRLAEVSLVELPSGQKSRAKFERGELRRWVAECSAPTAGAWARIEESGDAAWIAYAWAMWAIRCVIVSWGLNDGIDKSMLQVPAGVARG